MKLSIYITLSVFFLSCSSSEISSSPKNCDNLKVPSSYSEWKGSPEGEVKTPAAPNKAVLDRIQGCALLSFEFDKNGKARNVKILEEFPKKDDIGNMFALYLLSNNFPKSANTTKQAAVFHFNIEKKN